MNVFWLLAMAMLLAALAFVLPPLLRGRSGGARVSQRELNVAVYRSRLADLERERDSGRLDEVPVSLGPLVLRVETAALYLLGALRYEFGGG